MDSAHLPRMPSSACKPDQFSHSSSVCMSWWRDSRRKMEKWSGWKKDPHYLYYRGGKGQVSEKKKSHFSFVTSAVMVAVYYRSILNDVGSCTAWTLAVFMVASYCKHVNIMWFFFSPTIYLVTFMTRTHRVWSGPMFTVINLLMSMLISQLFILSRPKMLITQSQPPESRLQKNPVEKQIKLKRHLSRF